MCVCVFTSSVDCHSYHQKYQLRQMAPEALDALRLTRGDAVKDSTVLARLNGYISGYGSEVDFERDWPSYGIDDDEIKGVIFMRCGP